MKEFEKYKKPKGMSNIIYESDWLGHFSFILTTDKFNSRSARQLLDKNENQFVYLENQSNEIVDLFQMDLRTGYHVENGKWGFIWARHDHPFYMEEGVLCPRNHCVTEGLGIIWGTREEADLMMQHVSLIIRKLNRKGSYFRRYPTANDFLEDFLGMMKKISTKTMKPVELDDWSTEVLSEYTVS